MILADTNVMVDYFRSRESELAKKIDSMQVALCGAVRAELLHGARDDAEIDGFLNALRSNGIHVPTIDAMIAFTAIKKKLDLKAF